MGAHLRLTQGGKLHTVMEKDGKESLNTLREAGGCTTAAEFLFGNPV